MKKKINFLFQPDQLEGQLDDCCTHSLSLLIEFS